MTDEAFFDPLPEDACADDEPCGYAVPRTEATAERYAFLKTKRLGDTWDENGRVYRAGKCGITVFKLGAL
jgi:hypothetical protein